MVQCGWFVHSSSIICAMIKRLLHLRRSHTSSSPCRDMFCEFLILCTYSLQLCAITSFHSYSVEVQYRNSPESLSWHCGYPVFSREYHHCHHQLPLRRRRPRCIPLCVPQGGHCQSKWRWSDNPTVSYVSSPLEFCCVSSSSWAKQKLQLPMVVCIHFTGKPSLCLAVVTLARHWSPTSLMDQQSLIMAPSPSGADWHLCFSPV